MPEWDVLVIAKEYRRYRVHAATEEMAIERTFDAFQNGDISYERGDDVDVEVLEANEL